MHPPKHKLPPPQECSASKGPQLELLQYYLGPSFWVSGQKCIASELVPFISGKTFKPRPQNRILVPLRVVFKTSGEHPHPFYTDCNSHNRSNRGGTLQSFIWVASAPGSNPYHIPFWQKRYPFHIQSCSFNWEEVPLSHAFMSARIMNKLLKRKSSCRFHVVLNKFTDAAIKCVSSKYFTCN